VFNPLQSFGALEFDGRSSNRLNEVLLHPCEEQFDRGVFGRVRRDEAAKAQVLSEVSHSFLGAMNLAVVHKYDDLGAIHFRLLADSIQSFRRYSLSQAKSHQGYWVHFSKYCILPSNSGYMFSQFQKWSFSCFSVIDECEFSLRLKASGAYSSLIASVQYVVTKAKTLKLVHHLL